MARRTSYCAMLHSLGNEMNKERMSEVIDWAIPQGVQACAPPPLMNPNSFQARSLIQTLSQTEESVLNSVIEELKQEPDLSLFDGGVMLIGGGGATRLELRFLAEWLLAQALQHSSETAVGRLEEFIHGDRRAVLEVLALSGITIEAEIELPSDVKLVPFSSLPQSQMSDHFVGIPTWMVPEIRRPEVLATPTAALVIKDRNGIQLTQDFPEPPSIQPSSHEILWGISRCLTLFGPSAPTPVAHWFQVINWEQVPFAGTLSGWGAYIHEIFPREVTSLPNMDVRGVVEQYLALDERLKKKLTVPLERLNLALRRQNRVDLAIELGIALESLLMADRDQDAPISYLLRVRGALLGAGTLAEREELSKIVRDVYNLRSAAVHSGTLSARVSDREADEILRKGLSVCAKLLAAVIDRGSMPEWDTLILDSGADA
jgi:hypothetical protein